MMGGSAWSPARCPPRVAGRPASSSPQVTINCWIISGRDGALLISLGMGLGVANA